jgi:hypothetical protein
MIKKFNRKRTYMLVLLLCILITLIIVGILAWNEQQSINNANKQVLEDFKVCNPSVVCKLSYPQCFGVTIHG